MKPPWGSKNTNPNKANFKRDDGFSAYYTRDCHLLRQVHSPLRRIAASTASGPPGYGEGLPGCGGLRPDECRDESVLAMTFFLLEPLSKILFLRGVGRSIFVIA